MSQERNQEITDPAKALCSPWLNQVNFFHVDTYLQDVLAPTKRPFDAIMRERVPAHESNRAILVVYISAYVIQEERRSNACAQNCLALDDDGVFPQNDTPPPILCVHIVIGLIILLCSQSRPPSNQAACGVCAVAVTSFRSNSLSKGHNCSLYHSDPTLSSQGLMREQRWP